MGSEIGQALDKNILQIRKTNVSNKQSNEQTLPDISMTAPGGSDAARRNLTVIQFHTPATGVDSSIERTPP
jgi:hypothetical protein